MYRAFTFRLASKSFPVAAITREHPEVGVVAFNVGRDPHMALPVENIYVVRAPRHLHEIVKARFAADTEILDEVESPERDVLVFHAKYDPPEKGRLRGFLGVLGDAMGTVLDYRPMVIADGWVETSVLVLPRKDSRVRLAALAKFAKEEDIPFQVVRDDLVHTLPVRTPRLGVLDLLESQVFGAIAASGAYDLDGPAVDALVDNVKGDVEEALGIDDHTFTKVRRAAEKKVLREHADALRYNLDVNQSRRKKPAVTHDEE